MPVDVYLKLVVSGSDDVLLCEPGPCPTPAPTPSGGVQPYWLSQFGGGGGGGFAGGGYGPDPRAARPRDVVVQALGGSGASAKPTSATPSKAALAGAAALGAVGAAVVLRGREKPRRNPLEARAEAPKRRVPLSALPVAHGRSNTRRCMTCEREKPLDAFPPGVARKCLACRKAGAVVLYETTCIMCAKVFESPSSRASLCSPKCKKERQAELDRVRKYGPMPDDGDDDDDDPEADD